MKTKIGFYAWAVLYMYSCLSESVILMSTNNVCHLDKVENYLNHSRYSSLLGSVSRWQLPPSVRSIAAWKASSQAKGAKCITFPYVRQEM